jgi:hypothetical protein
VIFAITPQARGDSVRSVREPKQCDRSPQAPELELLNHPILYLVPFVTFVRFVVAPQAHDAQRDVVAPQVQVSATTGERADRTPRRATAIQRGR